MTIWDRLRAEPYALETIKQCLGLVQVDTTPYVSVKLWQSAGELYRLIEQAELGEAEFTARHRDDKIYDCQTCDVMRSKNQGGAIFTICDECWMKSISREPIRATPAEERRR